MATIHTFGPFRLDAEAKILFRGVQPTALGQRAVVLLRLLLERAGAPVSKDALIETAWPGLAIEDANLTVQIAALFGRGCRRRELDRDFAAPRLSLCRAGGHDERSKRGREPPDATSDCIAPEAVHCCASVREFER
jgi:hypothetical protein